MKFRTCVKIFDLYMNMSFYLSLILIFLYVNLCLCVKLWITWLVLNMSFYLSLVLIFLYVSLCLCVKLWISCIWIKFLFRFKWRWVENIICLKYVKLNWICYTFILFMLWLIYVWFCYDLCNIDFGISKGNKILKSLNFINNDTNSYLKRLNN